MKKNKIDERIDQFDQFNKNDKIYRKIRIHWLFTSFNYERRKIKIAKEMHWIENFRTKWKWKKIMKIKIFEMICSNKKTKYQKQIILYRVKNSLESDWLDCF